MTAMEIMDLRRKFAKSNNLRAIFIGDNFRNQLSGSNMENQARPILNMWIAGSRL